MTNELKMILPASVFLSASGLSLSYIDSAAVVITVFLSLSRQSDFKSWMFLTHSDDPPLERVIESCGCLVLFRWTQRRCVTPSVRQSCGWSRVISRFTERPWSVWLPEKTARAPCITSCSRSNSCFLRSVLTQTSVRWHDSHELSSSWSWKP